MPPDQKIYEVERISKFILEGPNMEQKYKVYWKGFSKNQATIEPARNISNVWIFFFWTKCRSELKTFNFKKAENQPITNIEKRDAKRNQKSLECYNMILGLGIVPETGYDSGKLNYYIKRYKHRVNRNHPDPFGMDTDADDPPDDGSPDEESLGDVEPLPKRQKTEASSGSDGENGQGPAPKSSSKNRLPRPRVEPNEAQLSQMVTPIQFSLDFHAQGIFFGSNKRKKFLDEFIQRMINMAEKSEICKRDNLYEREEEDTWTYNKPLREGEAPLFYFDNQNSTVVHIYPHLQSIQIKTEKDNETQFINLSKIDSRTRRLCLSPFKDDRLAELHDEAMEMQIRQERRMGN